MEEDSGLRKDGVSAEYKWPGSGQNSGLLISRGVCFLSHSLKEAEGTTSGPWPKWGDW